MVYIGAEKRSGTYSIAGVRTVSSIAVSLKVTEPRTGEGVRIERVKERMAGRWGLKTREGILGVLARSMSARRAVVRRDSACCSTKGGRIYERRAGDCQLPRRTRRERRLTLSMGATNPAY